MKCYFYDNGCGNGEYCSGMDAGPPSCNLSKNYITPSCNGNTIKCEVDKRSAENKTLCLNKLDKLKKQYEQKI